MSKIKQIIPRQILDSRGNPTVEVDVITEKGNIGRAAVPSGASTGSREALELRDGDKEYYVGKSVLKAIRNIQDVITKPLLGIDCCEQKLIDQNMLNLDGTEFKSKLGANALLAVSMAAARAGSLDQKKSLFRYMREDLKCPFTGNGYHLPNPMMNIINGGEHASNNLDIQEFMIIPHMKKSFHENLRAGVEIFHHLKKVLSEKGLSTNVGDEGGFAPNLKSHEAALDLIKESIQKSGYVFGQDVSLSLDVAASEFFDETKKVYKMQGREFESADMINYYERLYGQYPIYSIEDGLAEKDFSGWQNLNARLGSKMVLIGDDLFVTNKKILQIGIDQKQANAILIKVNQIGTLTETFETMDLAFKNNFKTIISHRSGETGDHFIADLAVATNAGHIKTGSASRSDRMEKYNQLLRIAEELGEKALYLPVK
jgi:enolase